MALVFPLIFFGLMWLLLVRPQQQRVRRQRELVMSLGVGEQVVTAGGVIGRIVTLGDEEVELEVAPGVVLRMLRIAINARAPEPAAGQPSLPEGEAEER